MAMMRIEPDNHKDVVEFRIVEYRAMLNAYELQVATEFALGYLGEKVFQMRESKQPVWAGQVVFDTEKVLDIRVNEEVQGSVWIGDEQKKIAHSLVAIRHKIDVFEPVAEEKKHFHVFVLYQDTGKEEMRAQVFNHNIRLIYDPHAKPDLLGERPEAVRMNFCLACNGAYLFQPEKPHRKYCSDRCSRRVNQRKHRAKRKKIEKSKKNLRAV